MNESDPFLAARLSMVISQLEGRGILDRRVLDAFRNVPRHEFVPVDYCDEAYHDRPLPLGPEQTISQPYIVGQMLQKAGIKPEDEVLEIGTGSGYQTALLCELAHSVYSIELDAKLQQHAQKTLQRLGYRDVNFHAGNGFEGWPGNKQFDVILVTASPREIPSKLVKQLKIGGRMIVPIEVAEDKQRLYLLKKTEAGIEEQDLGAVRFVEMKGSTE